MFDVIIGVVVGARPIRQGSVSQSSGFIEVRSEIGGSLRKLVTLVRGAQSERLRKERQSGVVEESTVACDGRCISNVGKTGGVTKI
jgi:hypothetical protein